MMAGRREGSLMRDKTQSFRGSRIVTAIVMGILLGCVFAFLFPHGFLSSYPPIQNRRFGKSDLQISSSQCESTERTTALRSDIASLSDKNDELKKEVQELTEKLRLSEQGKVHAHEQFSVLGKPHKAGPFGTVKGLRTNPAVVPDESVNPRLAKILEEVAVQKELIVALANSNVKSMLEVWFTSIKKVGITNYLVVGLDDEIEEFCKANDVPVYKRDPDEGFDSIGKTGGNHAVSGLKFRILREFLQLGYSVLLSDVDIVYLQNPFNHLYRDSDVESMTDGHNNYTAYGFNDVFDEPSMGWARYAHTMRIWVYNSGFFYIRPTLPAIELLDRVAERLSRPEKAWDQAVFNEELFFPSHPGYNGLHASKRTMDFYLFMNSKVLFKTVRKDANLKRLKPVILHVNYHPDKLPRMQAIMDFYVNGKQDALEPFPDAGAWLVIEMERFSQRESLLLGYSPQSAFVNSGSSSHTPTKNSDVDFHDVFGGPPRRSSTNEMRYSFGETTESSGLKRDAYDDDDDDSSGLIEKPVFGEGSVNRRRTQSDDFFDDIFKGNHSVSSSPRRLQRDPFASAPGSQVISPAHPLLHKPEPSAASSLPAQFSLPDGFSKGVVDLPAFGSAAHTSSLSRFSNQAIHEESRNDIRSSTRQSSSSRDFSLVGEGSSSLATSDKADTGLNSEQDSKSSENPTSSSPFQFHFSIYRWASKGVPIVIPLRGRNGSRVQERTKNEEDSSTKESAATESTRRESPKSTLPNTDFLSNEDPLADARSPTLERNIQENDLLLDEITPDKVDPQQFVEKAILPVTKSGTVSSLHDTTGDVSGNTISFHKSEDIKPHPLLQTASSVDRQKEIPALMERVHEPVLNTVRSLFFDDDLQQGNDEVTKTSSKKEVVVKSSADVDANKTAKHEDRKRSSSTKIEVIKASFQGSPKNSGDNLGRSKVKGKVKDFVKMFNQEVLCKPTYDGRNLGSHSSRTMDKGAPKAENEASITATRMNDYLQKSDVKNTFSDASVKMKEDLKQLEKEYSKAKTASFMLNNAPVQDTPASSTGSVPDGSKPIIEDADESFTETFQMKEITEDEKKELPPQPGNNREEFQAIDAKIRQWSRGKEGNIRSLLTTMQTVLWPESGWKTVPLVDIIEGNSVKRAYQRALLCLHPDKLQQKGAASHHKYLAAKVFDILQEAWGHFNSLGSL
ncbi:hypothetical protein FF2_016040 [Malus domestica]